jgi:hypothetical protein
MNTPLTTTTTTPWVTPFQVPVSFDGVLCKAEPIGSAQLPGYHYYTFGRGWCEEGARRLLRKQLYLP